MRGSHGVLGSRHSNRLTDPEYRGEKAHKKRARETVDGSQTAAISRYTTRRVLTLLNSNLDEIAVHKPNVSTQSNSSRFTLLNWLGVHGSQRLKPIRFRFQTKRVLG